MSAGRLEARALAIIDKGATDRLRKAATAKKPAAAAVPTVRLIRGDAVILEVVRWLWPRFIPAGMLTNIGGAPGCGKATIALGIAAVVTHGGTGPTVRAAPRPATC